MTKSVPSSGDLRGRAQSSDYFSSTMEAKTASGEVTLWRAVINLAMRDATMNYWPKPRSGHPVRAFGSNEKAINLHRARQWLLSNSRDFQRVCECALLDPEAVHLTARRAISVVDSAHPIIARIADGRPIDSEDAA